MLIDHVLVHFKAGDGGAGKVSFKRLGKGPDGGNGGKGGDLYVEASSDLSLLNQFSRKANILVQEGTNGSFNNETGKKGDDLVVKLPVGTSLINQKTNQVILELTEVGQKVKLLKGGIGGKGNFDLRSAKNVTPLKAQAGRKGEELYLILDLKLIADYGLIGLPNAGKSSLLNELTGSTAKTANYAFTTLEPNLGVINGRIIADIPGLIEGASSGRGLGIRFLKHIEKVKVLIHCIDSNSTDFKRDYEIVRRELGEYNKDLLKKKEIILLTKSDMVDNKVKFSAKGGPASGWKKALNISIHDMDAIDTLKNMLQ